MKLHAISDIHVGFRQNRGALLALPKRLDDWLIVAGDVAEREADILDTLAVLSGKFARVLWTPGNHELWSTEPNELRGDEKYQRLVAGCRALGVLTPEDPYPVWDGEGGKHVLALIFTLYDYSFADDGVSPREARARAEAAGIVCADEHLLHPDPFPSREAWCSHRCALTASRLEAAMKEHRLPFVLINHFPLKRELAVLPAVPPFKIWCGTRLTEHWAEQFGASVVVTGPLHIRSTRRIGQTRFEEVSLGYPGRQWDVTRGADEYLRTILPGPPLEVATTQ